MPLIVSLFCPTGPIHVIIDLLDAELSLFNFSNWRHGQCYFLFKVSFTNKTVSAHILLACMAKLRVQYDSFLARIVVRHLMNF